jgi:nitrogen fixation/metabolism regulation signal transduction histidine kinase
MRLRTQLALAFALLAVAPLALVVPWSIGRLRAILATDLQSRLASARTVATTVLREMEASSRIAVEDIAGSASLEDFARELRTASSAEERLATAERLMRSRGLSVLSLFSSDGMTLSSGHLPARVGDPDPTLFAIAQSGAKEAVATTVELRDESGLRRAPALVVARPFDYGELTIWVVGGQILDSRLAMQLAQMTGARVEISSADQMVASAGSEEPPMVETTVELAAVARVTLKLSRTSALKAEAVPAYAFVAQIALGLGIAALLGVLLARFITRPVEAVTAAARRIAGGAFDLKVAEPASGEVGELVNAFNRMSTELRDTTDRLIASERVAAWQEVARRLAHEIKNPLTPIKMSLETLIAASEKGHPRFNQLFRESAGAVLEEVERLRRIVDEFSQFARMAKPQLKPLSLSELAEQVLSLYGIPREGIDVCSQIARDVWVRGDRDQLTQVLLNLIKNAEEALNGSGRIEIKIGSLDGQAWLEVIDSGSGVPLEDRARIFEPYFTTKQGGSGLGLAIARRIAEEHGGQLDVGGEPGRGAVFTLRLPSNP